MIRRRLITAIVLLVAAIGSAWFWSEGAIDMVTLGTNITIASLGFLMLHHRWKRVEDRQITPKKAKDIFS